MKRFLDSEQPGRDFDGLEPAQQKLVFTHLLTEHRRALGAERSFKNVKDWMPVTDFSICTVRDRIHQSEDAKNDDDPYERAEQFRAAWTYDLGPVEGEVHWHTYDVYSEDAESELKVGPLLEQPRRTVPFYTRISSQLLLYRLCALFGTPSFRESDGYKSCWDTALVSSDKKCQLELYDYKGAAHVQFHGTEEGSKSAVSLLDFLLVVEMPHTYDGTIAGTAA